MNFLITMQACNNGVIVNAPQHRNNDCWVVNKPHDKTAALVPNHDTKAKSVLLRI